MKTMKTTLIAALVVMSAAVSLANAPASESGFAVVPVSGSTVYKVIYKGETETKVKLNVYNSQSVLIFSETLAKGNGFIRPLNFQGLASGEYTIELVGAAGKQTEKINFSPLKSNLKYVHVSRLASEEGKYILSVVSNTETASEVNINIYSEGTLVHKETKTINGEFAMVYNLKAISGNLTFEVTDNAGVASTVHF